MKKILYISSDIPSLSSTSLSLHDYSVIKYLKDKYQIYLLVTKIGNYNQRNKDFKKLILLKKKLNLQDFFLEHVNLKINYLDKLFLSEKFISPFLQIGKKYNSICKKYKIRNCYVSTGKSSLEAAYHINGVKKICNAEHPNSVNFEIKKKFENIYNPKKQIINPNKNKVYKFLSDIWYYFFIKRVKKIDCEIVKNFSLIICHNKSTVQFLRHQNVKSYYIPSFIIKKKQLIKKYKKKDFIIVANLSRQSSTSNYLSIHYLCHKFLPELKKLYKGNDIKIVILGNKSEDFDKKTKEILANKIFINKGWVTNADLELQKSDLFLLCGNAYLYKQSTIINNFKVYLSIAQSRIANIWANKVCLVIHSENKRCSAVLNHLDNCVLASSSKDLARWVIKLKNNSRLKDKIANNGYQTFKEKCQLKNYSQLLDKYLEKFFL